MRLASQSSTCSPVHLPSRVPSPRSCRKSYGTMCPMFERNGPMFRPPRRTWLITAAVAGTIVIGGFLIARQRQATNPGPVPQFVSTGRHEFLFQGTLKDWLPVSGQWTDAVDDDDAKVLAGSRGSVRRELSRLADGKRQPLENYRVT